jgi:hypothetical protein
LIDPIRSIDKRRTIFQLTAAVSIHYQRVGFAAELHNPQAELGVAGAEIAHAGGQCQCTIFFCFPEICCLQSKILILLHHFVKMQKLPPFVGILIHSDLHHMLMAIH